MAGATAEEGGLQDEHLVCQKIIKCSKKKKKMRGGQGGVTSTQKPAEGTLTCQIKDSDNSLSEVGIHESK